MQLRSVVRLEHRHNQGCILTVSRSELSTSLIGKCCYPYIVNNVCRQNNILHTIETATLALLPPPSHPNLMIHSPSGQIKKAESRPCAEASDIISGAQAIDPALEIRRQIPQEQQTQHLLSENVGRMRLSGSRVRGAVS